MAIADAFDMAYAIKCHLQIMLNWKIWLCMITIDPSLFDVLTKSTMRTGKTNDRYSDCQELIKKYGWKRFVYILPEFKMVDALTNVISHRILTQALITQI